MPVLKNIAQNVAAKEAIANSNFRATSAGALFAEKSDTTTGLTWGYYGGYFNNNTGTEISIADGTIICTANATNYVQFNTTTNTMQVNTTGFTVTNIPVAVLITNATTITNAADTRDRRRVQLAAMGTPGSGIAINAGNNYDFGVFDISARSGLQVTVKGGDFSWSNSLTNSVASISTFTDTVLNLTASSTGYIYHSNNAITFTTANIYALDARPLYKFTTNATQITSLVRVTDSFTNFTFKPVVEFRQTTIAVNSTYTFAFSFKDANTSGIMPNKMLNKIFLRCKTAEQGYAVGDLVTIYSNEPAVLLTSGGLTVKTHIAQIRIINLTTGNDAAITMANWELVLTIQPAN